MLKERIERYKEEGVRALEEQRKKLTSRSLSSHITSLTEGMLSQVTLKDPLSLGEKFARATQEEVQECKVCGKKSKYLLDGYCSAECALSYSKDVSSSYLSGYVKTASDKAVGEIFKTRTKALESLDSSISSLTTTANQIISSLNPSSLLEEQSNISKKSKKYQERVSKLISDAESSYATYTSKVVEKASLMARIQSEKEREVVAKLMKSVTSFLVANKKAMGKIGLPAGVDKAYDGLVASSSKALDGINTQSSSLISAYSSAYSALTSGLGSRYSLVAGGMYMFLTAKSIIKGDLNIVSLIPVNKSNPTGKILGSLDNTLFPLVSEKLDSVYRPTEADRFKAQGEFANILSKGITSLSFLTPLLASFKSPLGGFKLQEEAIPLWEELNLKNIGFLLWSHNHFGAVGSNHFGLPF